MLESRESFTSGGFVLSGTLTTPNIETPAPAVLLLPGSGKVDRDDNAKQLRIDLFPQLIPSLTSIGFATFRYDKRGVGESGGDFLETGLEDLLDDVRSAINWLKNRQEIDASKIFILGHSEGALLSVRATAENESIAGAILLAGPAKNGEETILWQTQKISQSASRLNRAITKLLRIDVVKLVKKNLEQIKATSEDTARIQGKKINAKWFREFLAYDPSTDLGKLHQPTLAITGSEDIQVDPSDLRLMVELTHGNLESHEVPGLTHLLRRDPSKAGIKSYKKQTKQPVDPSILELVTNWLAKQIS